jgi:Gpi18-like mannosyltransferase
MPTIKETDEAKSYKIERLLRNALKWKSIERLKSIRWFWFPAFAFLITRSGIFLIAYLSVPLLNDSNVPLYHIKPDNILLDVFGSRWDTGFYLSIAEEGYKYQGVELPSVAFFPLLPLLIRLVSSIIGDPLVSGILISNTALFFAMILLYLLVDQEFGEDIARRAVWYMLIFPTSFFGSAIYTESLFLLGTIGALYLARKRFWESAALSGVLTALTRFLGILLAPLLLIEWWMQRRTSPKDQRPSLFAAVAGLVVPLGTIAYMLYLNAAFGDPLAFANAAEVWGRQPQTPWVTLTDLFQRPPEGWAAGILAGHIQIDNWLDLLIVILFLILGIVLLKRRRWAEGVFVLLGALLPLSSGLLMSQRRYMWVLFPAFILLARWGENEWVDRTLNVIFILMLAVFTAMYANGYWVG